MSIQIVPSVECIQLLSTNLLDLPDIISSGDLYCALARASFNPDQGDPVTYDPGGGTFVWPRWEASTAYAGYDLVRPSPANNHLYEAIVPGTSDGVSQPAFPTDGGTVTDGGDSPPLEWRDLGVAISHKFPEFSVGGTNWKIGFPGQNNKEYESGTGIVVGEYIYNTQATAGGTPDRIAVVTSIGTGVMAGTEPVFDAQIGNTVTDSNNNDYTTAARNAANVVSHPWPAELEIEQDAGTNNYPQGGVLLTSQTLTLRGRSAIVDFDDVDFGDPTTISAGWLVVYANREIIDGSNRWSYPIIGLGLLDENRDNVANSNGTYTLTFNAAGALRIR